MTQLVNVLNQMIRDAGHQLTTARRAVVEALVTSGGHVTADELVPLVREQAPRVGRMTVYRTLELLSRVGGIRPVYQGSGAAHYILLEDGHHHHLVCSKCATIVELTHCGLEELQRELEKRFGFSIQGHLVEFYGLCTRCQSAGMP